MSISNAFTGKTWSSVVPPGVYEDVKFHQTRIDVFMDVAAFIGLAERGPINTPVIVESWGEFKQSCGRNISGPLLPQSGFNFFANGGRRCVVIRTCDYQHAQTAITILPGLKSEIPGEDLIFLAARSPGQWGNRLNITSRFDVLTLGGTFDYASIVANKIKFTGKPPEEGSLLRFTNASNLENEYYFIEEIE